MERPDRNAGAAPERKPRRPSRGTLKIASAVAAGAAFALPWGVLHAVPSPPTLQASGGQVVVLPGGQRVVIPQGPVGANGVRYVYVKGAVPAGATAAVSTHASAVPKH